MSPHFLTPVKWLSTDLIIQLQHGAPPRNFFSLNSVIPHNPPAFQHTVFSCHHWLARLGVAHGHVVLAP